MNFEFTPSSDEKKIMQPAVETPQPTLEQAAPPTPVVPEVRDSQVDRYARDLAAEGNSVDFDRRQVESVQGVLSEGHRAINNFYNQLADIRTASLPEPLRSQVEEFRAQLKLFKGSTLYNIEADARGQQRELRDQKNDIREELRYADWQPAPKEESADQQQAA